MVGSLKFSHSGCFPICHREIFPQGGRSVFGENPTSNVLYSSRRSEGLVKFPYVETSFGNGLLTLVRWLANFPRQYRLQVLVRLVRACLSILVSFSGWIFLDSIIVSKYTHPLFRCNVSSSNVSSKPTASICNPHTYPVVINWQWVSCFDNYVIPLACLAVKYMLSTVWYPAYLCLLKGGSFCKDVWARNRYRLSAMSDYQWRISMWNPQKY